MARKSLLASLCALAILWAGAGVVAAGEITGNGEDLKPLRANSECAFSGLDDDDDDGFVHTQSWGRLGREGRAFFKSIGVVPQVFCNGHLHGMK